MKKQISLKDSVNLASTNFKSALPPGVAADRFVQICAAAALQNPGLENADRRSVLSAFMECAKDGLLPDGREATIVLRGKNAGYMPMVNGVLKRIRSCPGVLEVNASIVYSNELYERGVNDGGTTFRHEPIDFGDKGEPIGAYAFARTSDGGFHFESMDKTEIEKVKEMAMKDKKSGPWITWKFEMWKKTVIHRLNKRFKFDDLSDRVARRVEEAIDIETPPLPTPTSQRLLDAVVPEAKEDAPQESEDVL